MLKALLNKIPPLSYAFLWKNKKDTSSKKSLRSKYEPLVRIKLEGGPKTKTRFRGRVFYQERARSRV